MAAGATENKRRSFARLVASSQQLTADTFFAGGRMRYYAGKETTEAAETISSLMPGYE
jgi:hypothetical protein